MRMWYLWDDERFQLGKNGCDQLLDDITPPPRLQAPSGNHMGISVIGHIWIEISQKTHRINVSFLVGEKKTQKMCWSCNHIN